MAVMMVGVGLFGVLTGYLANAFLSPSKKAQDELQKIEDAAPAPDTQAELAEIKRMLLEQEQAQKELRVLLTAFKETTR